MNNHKFLYGYIYMCILAICLGCSPAEAQIFKKKEKEAPAKKEADKKTDSPIKPYEDVITEEAKSQEGLLDLHEVGSKHYFEIPNDLLEEEILIVTRISGYVEDLSFGGAGMKSRPQQVIRWQRLDDKILLRSVSYNSVASEEHPIYESVKNNNFEPVIMTFDIKAISPDSAGVVIQVDPLFTQDIPMIGAVSQGQRKKFEIKGLDKSRSLITRMNAFPENIEIRHILTYKGTKLPDNKITNTLSVELNQSMILLPEEPMQPRYYDARVGYYSIKQTNYSLDEQRAAKQQFITRWRLEPKDMDAFNRGELVEPKKPIVYYIDPATPKKWRPYIKQGVEDWQPAFEEAGFKNAIIAKDPPSKEENPGWSPEDVRYSVIRYVSTDIQNAMGPHVHDPRSGEILESDIIWYHNVMNLLRNWFFVQTAAVNPEARGVKFKDEVMGNLIRFVSAHEVGHTLGLPHNWGSSVAYPVDSLRSPTFTSTHGTAPSIMDYARFNYIAQPEDSVLNFFPAIGEYDKWSIIYGYKPIPEANSPDEEEPILNEWIRERANNPLFRYGAQTRSPHDPTAQREDLGDDAIYASELGIKNLKRIVPNLIEWSYEEGKDFEQLKELYQQVFNQLGRYMTHVTNVVGGVYDFPKTQDENEVVYTYVPRDRQKAAVDFLNKYLFDTPEWLLEKPILQRIEKEGTIDRLRSLQVTYLKSLFQPERLLRMTEAAALSEDEVYALDELFSDTRQGVFSEISMGTPIDPFRRNLQRAYLDEMESLVKEDKKKYNQTDMSALARGTLMTLDEEIEEGLDNQSAEINKIHLKDLQARIEIILDDD